ncbi:MAG: GbsR/MarR family transcriptional regulator [Phycisphaerales bacterium]|jgi:DNA-binding transcriptional regulator GbsR (MarR family)
MSPDDDRDANFTRLRETQDRFIALWGDMGSHWGVPRSMAEIHALLFIVGEPLSADEIMERLRVSRGNVSMTLRSLVEWGIVSRSHRREDRRDRFHAEQDVWKLLITILRVRKRREIDPLLESLRGCELEGSPSKATADRDSIAEHNDRVRRMVDMISSVDQLADRLIGPAGPSSEDLESLVRGLAELPQ